MNLEFLVQQPPENTALADRLLQDELMGFQRKIIALDDDPTGVQTVHDVSVYTDWEESSIREGFTNVSPLIFILTNSRGLTSEQTFCVHQEIARRIGHVSADLGKEYVLISRSDSTLRGHYPLETKTLCETLENETGTHFHGEIICPFFPEGGRYTIDSIHYVKEGDQLTLAAETEFAKDKTFGYENSFLPAYVEEKSKGSYPAKDCICISIADLRACNADRITNQLMQADNFAKIIVDAVSYTDLKVFCTAWIRAMKQGHNFIARSAAALPKVIGNISDQPLLNKKALFPDGMMNSGLVIVGSHVKKTTQQLNELMKSKNNLLFLEFDVSSCTRPGGLKKEADRIRQIAEKEIPNGYTVIIYTSRKLMTPDGLDKDALLSASVDISNALTSIVSDLTVCPGFIIAKGGITSSDVGTKGLGVKRAEVLGQIAKGIPVWRTGPESKFPGLPYVIFPGNVGDATTLLQIVDDLMGP